MILDPTRVFEVQGEVCELKTAMVILAIGNNQEVIAAVSGKQIRVMGLCLAANTATQPGVVLRDGNGGTIKVAITPPANTNPPFLWPIVDSGYFSLTVSTKLSADITTAAANIHVHYIEYTPR